MKISFQLFKNQYKIALNASYFGNILCLETKVENGIY